MEMMPNYWVRTVAMLEDIAGSSLPTWSRTGNHWRSHLKGDCQSLLRVLTVIASGDYMRLATQSLHPLYGRRNEFCSFQAPGRDRGACAEMNVSINLDWNAILPHMN